MWGAHIRSPPPQLHPPPPLDPPMISVEEPTVHFPLVDPRGGRQGRAPPPGSKFFHFHAVFGKKLKNNSTFGSWGPPPGKNPGSATAFLPVLVMGYRVVGSK